MAKPPPRFVPRPCELCAADTDRPKSAKPKVYGKHGRIRYCKCSWCKHTWTQVTSYKEQPEIATESPKQGERSPARVAPKEDKPTI